MRLCSAYGNQSAQYICCSATLGNPEEHFRRLIPVYATPLLQHGHAPIAVVAEDCSAAGRRIFGLWRPGRHREAHVNHDGDSCGSPFSEHSHGPAATDTTAASEVDTTAASEADTTVTSDADTTAASEADTAVPAKPGSELVGATSPPKFDGSSAIMETALLLSALVKRGVRTLCFCKIRKLAELVLAYTKRDLKATAGHLVDKVKAYRAGYSKEDRRELERAFFSGELLGVTATSALELGVDVGSLDCTLLLGFPGSIASMWQQAGRSGRNARDALTLMVLFDSPADQFYAENPSFLFDRKSELATVDPDNVRALEQHLLLAAAEAPFDGSPTGLASTAGRLERRVSLFGSGAWGMLEGLVDRGLVQKVPTAGGWLLSASKTLARQRSIAMSIRSIDEKSVTVLRESDKRRIDELP